MFSILCWLYKNLFKIYWEWELLRYTLSAGEFCCSLQQIKLYYKEGSPTRGPEKYEESIKQKGTAGWILFCIFCTFIPFPFSKTAGNFCCKAAGPTTTYAHPVEQQDVQQQYIQLLAAWGTWDVRCLTLQVPCLIPAEPSHNTTKSNPTKMQTTDAVVNTRRLTIYHSEEN